MIPKIADYLNQLILVSIPTLHSDTTCRSFILRGVELTGLWLQSDELVKQLTPDDAAESVDPAMPAFVTFSHIACVIFPRTYKKVPGFPDALRVELEKARKASAQPDKEDTHKRSPDRKATKKHA